MEKLFYFGMLGLFFAAVGCILYKMYKDANDEWNRYIEAMELSHRAGMAKFHEDCQSSIRLLKNKN